MSIYEGQEMAPGARPVSVRKGVPSDAPPTAPPARTGTRMSTDLENAIPVDDRGNVILTTLDAVIDAHLGQITTHYTNCWKDHAGCLAVVLKLLLIEGTAPAPVTPTRQRINALERVRYGSLPNWA